MPRKGRLHIPGGCYHVIGRGLERRHIFSEDADKNDFLARLGLALENSQSQCLAWTLMSNHYHLLIRVGATPLCGLMAPLLGGYGGSYNRRHGRCGYVFQNRYQSILCDENNYLLELVRYIHLNPIRANIFEDLSALDRYPWTGHAGMLDRHRQPWHEVTEILQLFSGTRKNACGAYRQFIGNGLNHSHNQGLSGGGLIRSNGGWESVNKFRKEHVQCIGDERILGNEKFVSSALREDELRLEQATRRQIEGWNLDSLIKYVCDYCGIQSQELGRKARGRQLGLAKSLICHWGVEELQLSMSQLANRLQISQQAISKWVPKGRDICERKALRLDDLGR